jgi:hypothetical protein
MVTNYDPDSNIDDLTDIEIYAAIRYLEPEPTNADEWLAAYQDDKDKGVVICVCLYIVLLVCVAFLWFYWL